MQESLQKAFAERMALGMPAPSAVSFEYEITSAREKAGPGPMARATEGPVVHMTSKTVVHFDNPQQAGYERWPDLIVNDEMPEGTYGSIKPGNYNQLIHDKLAKQIPGIWDIYEFGYEPRTYTFVETFTGTYDEQSMELFEQLAGAALDSTALEEILLGFTFTGPDYDYTIDWSFDVLEVTVIEFEAGFAFDYGLGLRLPMEAGLTSPDLMPEGSSFLPASTIAGLDWEAADYEEAGLAPEDGNEFVMRFKFICGIFLEVFGVDVIDIGINVDENKSASFETPFGPGATFDLPGINIPVWGKDVGVASLEIGFTMTPKLGSDKATADWQASGDFAASGQLTYTAPLTPVTFGPIPTIDGPSQTDLQIDGFRYYFTQFLIEMGAYITLDVFSVWDGTFGIPITDFDLSALTGSLYVGVHEGTSGSISKTIYIENVPPTAEIDRTGTVPIGGKDTFIGHIGSPLTFTGYATDPGKDDLTLAWDWDDGPPSPDILTLYPVPYSVTESQTHIFTGGCMYHVTFSVTDDDGGYADDQVPVLITAADNKVRREGYWQHQYRGNGKTALDAAALECYLGVASHMSTVFDEVEDASSIKAAHDILFLKNHHGNPIDQFDRELLVVWLNLANGAIDYDDMVDTDRDGAGDTALYDVVLAAEQVRLDPNASRVQLRNQTQILHLIYSRVK